MRDKKSEERVAASFLLKKIAPAALSYLEDGPEEPDFLTKLGRKKLGVEVRSLRDDLISGSHARAATEGTQDSIVARAQKIYENRRLPAAQVYVVWGRAASRRVNTRAVSEALVDAVAPALTMPLPASGFAAAVVGGAKCPDAGVVRLRVYRTAKASRGSWFSLRGGWGTPCPPDAIQKALDDKEAKVRTYRKKARTVWLALTILGTSSSKLLLPKTMLQARYRSSFDRVFLVDLSREQVHELRLKRLRK